jgi:hypothetical protein
MPLVQTLSWHWQAASFAAILDDIDRHRSFRQLYGHFDFAGLAAAKRVVQPLPTMSQMLSPSYRKNRRLFGNKSNEISGTNSIVFGKSAH